MRLHVLGGGASVHQQFSLSPELESPHARSAPFLHSFRAEELGVPVPLVARVPIPPVQQRGVRLCGAWLRVSTSASRGAMDVPSWTLFESLSLTFSLFLELGLTKVCAGLTGAESHRPGRYMTRRRRYAQGGMRNGGQRNAVCRPRHVNYPVYGSSSFPTSGVMCN